VFLLDRYIGRNVLAAIVAVLGIILSLALLFAFIDELSDIEGSYGLLDAAWYVLLTAPRRLYDMLPMAALIGCLIGLGSLASHSELTIMRAAGVPVARIVWAVMKPMLTLMLAAVLLGEYIVPLSEAKAQTSRALAQNGGVALGAKRGLWHRQGQEFIHINAAQTDSLLYGITRYQFDGERRLLAASFAKSARYENGRWQLFDLTVTRFEPKASRVENKASEDWPIELAPELLGTLLLDPEMLPLKGLWRYIHYLADQGLNNSRYWLAFWSKLLQPLVTAALLLLAISFIFGPLRSVTLGQRVFSGTLVGFIFRIVQDLLGPASLVFGFPPLLAVLIPCGICMLAGGVLLRRAS